MVPTKTDVDNPFDTELIKSNALKDLLDVIDSVRGKKALVIDPSLTGTLGLISKFSLLRDHGIDKVYHLDPSPFTVPQDKIIYLLRPQKRNTELVVGILYPHPFELTNMESKYGGSLQSHLSLLGNTMSTLYHERQPRVLES